MILNLSNGKFNELILGDYDFLIFIFYCLWFFCFSGDWDLVLYFVLLS